MTLTESPVQLHVTPLSATIGAEKPGGTRTLNLRGAFACNIPAQVEAYSLNLAALPSGPLGFLTVWPSGLTRYLILNPAGVRLSG
jgi:hypothetical protein